MAECGTGKTLISLGSVYAHAEGRPFTALAMVPPQLVEKWARECFLTIPGVRVFANALAAREGTLVLEDPLLGEWGYRTAEAGQGTVVPAVTMARLFACFPEADPFIVKIDIEGGEAPLFETGADWLDRTPLVIIELHDWMLPGSASSRSFLRAVASRNRDFVHLGENVYSIHNGLV